MSIRRPGGAGSASTAPTSCGSVRVMGWWIVTGVVLLAAVGLWLWMHHLTDLGSRSRQYEGSAPEIAEALRQAERDRNNGRMYP